MRKYLDAVMTDVKRSWKEMFPNSAEEEIDEFIHAFDHNPAPPRARFSDAVVLERMKNEVETRRKSWLKPPRTWQFENEDVILARDREGRKDYWRTMDDEENTN